MIVPLTTNDFVERAVKVYPTRVALTDVADGLGVLTWAELGQRLVALRSGLDALGLERGARIAAVGMNTGRMLELLLSVPAAGRILVPINPRLSAAEIAHIVEDCGAQLLLVEPEHADRLRGITVERFVTLGAESDRLLLEHGLFSPEITDLDENDTATINYTSGTTSAPKGVQLTHRNIWLNAVTLALHIGLCERDVYLHTLPMFHVNGWGMPFVTASLGVHNVMLCQVRGEAILQAIDEHGVTVLNCAPTVLSATLDAAAARGGQIPGHGSVRVVCAGAPPPTALIERVETELGWEFIQVYGLTETSPMTTISRRQPEEDRLSPQERSHRRVRQGAPFLGARVTLGTDGEVLIRSNHVMSGYWNQPSVTADAIRDGWFHSGDVGFFDGDGQLCITDRKKDVIITGGENVSSIQVEDCLAAHPAIHDVAVAGTPHERWGETVTAFITRIPGCELTEVEVIAWARARLAHYKTPTRVVFLDELPRTATGKVQKHILRNAYKQHRVVPHQSAG
ncbi:AMP-binding protein [Rhodococcus koreensis]